MRRFLWAGPNIENKISWVAWDVVTKPKNKGGLGIFKIQDVNNALLLKWTWRFKNEGGNLWKKIIMGCHGSSRPWSLLPCSSSSSGCWKYIVKVGDYKLSNGRTLNSYFSGDLGDGRLINFWSDPWLLPAPLRALYPNLFQLEKNKWVKACERLHCVNNIKQLSWDWISNPATEVQVGELFDLLNHIHNFVWHGGADRWIWNAEKDGRFTVASAKKLLSSNDSDDGNQLIRWKCWVPLKCRILIWRILRNRIPTVDELRKRGVNITITDCSLCGLDSETTLHLFTGCSFSNEVWYRIENWCKLPHNFWFDIPDILHMVESQPHSKKSKYILRGIVYTSMWMIWSERNERIFNNKMRQPIQIVENIKATAYFWIRNKSRWKSIDWNSWCIFPLD